MFRLFNRDGTCNIPTRSSDPMPPLSVLKKRKRKMPEKPSRFLACPLEIQLHVLEFVPKEGLVALSRVNKHLASIAQPVLHREVDVNCPGVSLECHAAPLVLALRTLLSRPDLAQAVQHLRFDGYDFVERRVDKLPTTPIFHLTVAEKMKAVRFIYASGLSRAAGWSYAFSKGVVDSLVCLVLALAPNVRSIYLGEFFSVEISCLNELLLPESEAASQGSNLHKFEHLRRVTVNNHGATYLHNSLNFNNIYHNFFRLPRLENLSISGSFPDDAEPFTISTKLEHLRCLDLCRIEEAELGRILSIAPNLTGLKYTYAYYPLARYHSGPVRTLNLDTLRDSLEGHRLKLERLELLVIDDVKVLHSVENRIWALVLQGGPFKLYDFSNLRTLTVPWIFIVGPSKGEHPSPLRYLIPKSVVQLTLTDDLHQQPYYNWNPKEIWEMVTDYLNDVKDTKAALAAMYLVGPMLAKIFKYEKLRLARRIARSAGVDLRAVEMTIPESDELREAEERARRYGRPPKQVRAELLEWAW